MWQREPDLPHSLEALVAILLGLEKPPGSRLVSGLEKLVLLLPVPLPPHPISLEFQGRVWEELEVPYIPQGMGLGGERGGERQKQHREEEPVSPEHRGPVRNVAWLGGGWGHV